MPSANAPAPDATVVRYGIRRFLTVLPGSLLLIAPAVLDLYAAVTGSNGVHGPGPWLALLLLVPLAALGALMLRVVWVDRDVTIALDSTGLWWVRGKTGAVIPWDSLAGVGLHWSKSAGLVGKHHTFELCPLAPIDRDHPLLWHLVRDDTPLRPGLPRLRYRLQLPLFTRRPLARAVQRLAPQLWFGDQRRDYGYRGLPDASGHAQRLRDG